jgi:hypothetical protein
MYANELRRLRQEIARKRRGKLTQGVLLLHDNAPADTSSVAIAAATDCGFELLLHPQYSPDFAPSDFYLFPKLKIKLRGRRFGSNAKIGLLSITLSNQLVPFVCAFSEFRPTLRNRPVFISKTWIFLCF